MRKVVYIIALMIFGVWLFQYCVEPFDVENVDYYNALVVEGNITDEHKPHEIVLSRSYPVDTTQFIPETDATVWVESDAGTKISFNEEKPGKYYSPSDFGGEIGTTYQLFITTKDGSEYESEPVTMRKTPPIDSVYTRLILTSEGDEVSGVEGDGIMVYLDTHDPNGNTNYYRWEWTGTYEIRVPYPSVFEFDPEINGFWEREEDVSRCWANVSSTNILVKSTTNLVDDKVSRFPVQFISENSQWIRTMYSVIVKQYSLSPEAYFFWENLRKINETQGGLSDIQPGILEGNIHSVSNETETVLGYFDAVQASQKRIFINPRDYWGKGLERVAYFYDCEIIQEEDYDVVIELFTISDNYEYLYKTIMPTIYVYAPYQCSNCSRFASTEKPDFWEE